MRTDCGNKRKLDCRMRLEIGDGMGVPALAGATVLPEIPAAAAKPPTLDLMLREIL